MPKKVILIFVLLVVYLFSLNAQVDSNAKNNRSSQEELLAQRKQEIQEARIKLVNDYRRSGNKTSIDTLFKQDEAAYYSLLKEGHEDSAFMKKVIFMAYRNVESLQDDLLFLECKRSVYSKNWAEADLKARDLLRRYPVSNRKNQAVHIRKMALIKLDKDAEYVALVEEYPEFKTDSQKFWYGQALYNTGRYNDAQLILEKLVSKNNYALRSLAMLGLIAAANDKVADAVDYFDYIEKNFPMDSKYYDYAILSKARLYAHIKDLHNAIAYYQAYTTLKNGDVERVAYEIAITYRNSGNLKKAKALFEGLLSTPFAEEFYVPTVYNLVLIDKELNSGSKSASIINNYQARIDSYFNDLLANRKLTNEVKALRNKLIVEDDSLRKTILREDITAKEKAILANQADLETKISFISPKYVSVVKQAEWKYIEKTENYLAQLDLIEKYRNQSKDRLIYLANNDRDEKEEGYLFDLTEILLGNIESPSDNQYLRAYKYANQIYGMKKYIVNLNKVIDKTANKAKYRKINSKCRELLALELKQLDEVKVEAMFHLSELDDLDSKKDLVDEKAEELIVVEAGLEKNRKRIIDDLYDSRADKLAKTVQNDFNALDGEISTYSKIFNKFNNIKNAQQIHLDFIELDLEYRVLSKRYSDAFSQLGADSLSGLSDEFVEGINNSRKTLYNKMNTFVFKHSKFARNDQLYFDMAELSTSIYSENKTLIIKNYSKVLELNPEFNQKDIVYYNLAYYEQALLDLQIGDLVLQDMAKGSYEMSEASLKTTTKYSTVIGYYKKLLKESESKYHYDAMFRLADLYFDIAVDSNDPQKYLGKSIVLYNYIIASTTDVVLTREALFQRAYYKMALREYTSSLADLSLLLADVDMFNEKESLNYEASYDIAAYNINFLDGFAGDDFESVKYVEESLFNEYDEYSARVIYNKLLKLKQAEDFDTHVIKLYEVMPKIYPLALSNPLYCDSVLTVYQTQRISSDSLNKLGESEYRKAVVNYGLESEWYQFNKEYDLRPYMKFVQKGLEDFIIPDAQNRAQTDYSLEKINEFASTVNNYASYVGFDSLRQQSNLRVYDNNKIAMITDYVKIKEDLDAYALGINEIHTYLLRAGDIDNRKDLEQNAYVYSKKSMNLIDTLSYDSLQYSSTELDELKSSSQADYIVAANRYFDYLDALPERQNDDTIFKLLFERGLTKNKVGDQLGAKEDFLACETLNITDSEKRDLYLQLAEIFKLNFEYDVSNDYLAKAIKYEDSSDQQKAMSESIVNNRLSKIEQLKLKGDFSAVAQEYDTISKSEVIDEDTKNNILESAARSYLQSGDYAIVIDRKLNAANKELDYDKAENLYAYAWQLAKDSLRSNERYVEIQDIFIDRYPTKNLSFDIRLRRALAHADSLSTKYNSELAASQFMDLYNDATVTTGEKLDIGEMKPMSLYMSSITELIKTKTKEEEVDIWIEFQRVFPEEEPIEYLKLICSLYDETGQTENYLKYIRILFEKDKSSTLFKIYVAEQLGAISEKTTIYGKNEDWVPMLKSIDEFKKRADGFIAEGIDPDELNITSVFEAHKGYIAAYEFDKENKAYVAKLAKEYEAYLPFYSDESVTKLRVNNATRWEKNLVGGDQRFKVFEDKIDSRLEVLNRRLLEVEESRSKYKIDDEAILNYYYLLFKTNALAFDVLKTKIEKFRGFYEARFESNITKLDNNYEISEDEYESRLSKLESDNDTMANNIEDKIYDYEDKYRVLADSYSRYIYSKYINGYSKSYAIADEVIGYMQSEQFPEVAEADTKDLVPDDTWRTDFSSITNSAYSLKDITYSMFEIPSGDSLVLETIIDNPISPQAYRFRLLSNVENIILTENISLSIKSSGTVVDINSFGYNGTTIDTTSIYPIVESNVLNLLNTDEDFYFGAGKNDLKISVVNNSLNKLNIGFTIEVMYNKEYLFEYNNSEVLYFYSDNSWVGADSISTVDTLDVNFEAVRYGLLDFDYSQVEDMAGTLAIPIWYGEESVTQLISTDTLLALTDSTLTDSLNIVDQAEPQEYVKYFAKEFDITGKVLESDLFFYADTYADVWLNGEMIGEYIEYSEDPDYAPNIFIEPDMLKEGKNLLVFGFYSPRKENGLVVHLKVKVLNTKE